MIVVVAHDLQHSRYRRKCRDLHQAESVAGLLRNDRNTKVTVGVDGRAQDIWEKFAGSWVRTY